MPDKIRKQCEHGYWLMQDSCPGCDAMTETPHKAQPVTVTGFHGRTVLRCQCCGQVRSARQHRGAVS